MKCSHFPGVAVNKHTTHTQTPKKKRAAGQSRGGCPGVPSRRGEPADAPAEARLGVHARIRGRNPGAGARCAPVPRAPEPPAGKGVSVPRAPRGAEPAEPGELSSPPGGLRLQPLSPALSS